MFVIMVIQCPCNCAYCIIMINFLVNQYNFHIIGGDIKSFNHKKNC